jgi:hypothetical protein
LLARPRRSRLLASAPPKPYKAAAGLLRGWAPRSTGEHLTVVLL